MKILLSFVLLSLAGPLRSSDLAISIECQYADVLTVRYNGKSFVKELQPGTNSIEFELIDIHNLDEINSFSIQFTQKKKRNRITIKYMRFSTAYGEHDFSGSELYKMFNENYFVQKSVIDNLLVLNLNRYWQRPALLMMNDKLSIPTDKRISTSLKIEGKPRRSIFTVLYYTTESGSFSISKYFSGDSIEFDIFSETEVLNFQLFLGDYQNEIEIEKIQMVEDGNMKVFEGSEILENFGFNHFITTKETHDAVGLDILTYKGKTSPLLTYRRKSTSVREQQTIDYTVDVFGSVFYEDDIFEFVASDGIRDILRRRVLIKNDSVTPFNLRFHVATPQPVVEVELLVKNKSNSYIVDSIRVTAGTKTRLFDSKFIAKHFTMRNLSINEQGQVKHMQANTGYASLYYETDYLFIEDRVRHIMKYLTAFAIATFAFLLVNKRVLSRIPA